MNVLPPMTAATMTARITQIVVMKVLATPYRQSCLGCYSGKVLRLRKPAADRRCSNAFLAEHGYRPSGKGTWPM